MRINYPVLNQIDLQKAYAQNKTALRVLLSNTTFNFAQVVDVKWRLDYYVRSSGMERIDKPLYYIVLKTIENGKSKDIEFTCSLENMQELVYKLRDAVKQVENYVEKDERK